MAEFFSQIFHVRWSDLDPNLHMRHTAYLDMCAATRFKYLESLGFDMKTFSSLKVGPILFDEHIKYRKEVLAGDQVKVNVLVSGLSEAGHKWRMRQEMTRVSDGQLAAVLDISGAWFNIVERSVSSPPDILKEKMNLVPRTEDFAVL